MAINISGQRFPNAAIARHGILLAPLARHFKSTWGANFILDGAQQYLKISTPNGTEYRLYPNLNATRSEPQLVFYLAYNVNTGLTEYMIGGYNWPDIFAVYADSYANLALDFFTYSGITGAEADYELSSKLVGWLAMRGEFGEALSMVGDAWMQAATSKEFWVTTIFSMVTRGVFKLANRTPRLPGTGGTPPPPSGGGNTIKRSPPPPANALKVRKAPIHANQLPPITAGRTQPMSAAHARLLQTFDDVLNTKPIRTSYVLQRQTTYRHIIMSDNPAATAVQIQRSGVLIHSTGGNAHYGRGAYVYGEGRGASSTGKASYVDIQVPAGVAVERIALGSQEPFFRLMSASGNSVPGKIVGTNIPVDLMKRMETLIDGAK